jgi:hypothetical protein
MKFLVGMILGFLIGYQLGRIAAGREGTPDLAVQGRRLASGAQSAMVRARASMQSRRSGDGETWD